MAATKASLISTINGFITSVVIVAKVRNAYLELINVFFSTIKTEIITAGTEDVGNTILASDKSYVTCNLNLKKEGNKVFIKGTLQNVGTLSQGVAGTVILDITNSEFTGKTGLDQIFQAITANGYTFQLQIKSTDTTKIVIRLGSFNDTVVYHIDSFYYIND